LQRAFCWNWSSGKNDADRQGLCGKAACEIRADAFLKRFRAKWRPVRVKKTRRNIKLEPCSDSIRTGLQPPGNPTPRIAQGLATHKKTKMAAGLAASLYACWRSAQQPRRCK